ncbi:MAG: efflux RND transporter permease subunit [Bacillota bacterium]|nr:efflux RND transporter permease subunit [Bacillota bacterium]
MNLPSLAVKRPVATGTILVLILIIGLVSLYQSPLDLLPEIQAPVLAIITTFPGSSPQETLELVTKPIEDSVAAVSGLTGINSFSQENLSLVILRLDWGSDIKRLRDEVNVRMDLLSFPDGVQRPLLLEFDPTLLPIMQVSASGADDPVKLTEWLEETAAPRLESLRGVASVQVQGGARQDLFVRAFPDQMADYQVSFEQIANIIRASLLDLPAGIIDIDNRQVRIRFLGRFTDSAMLEDLIVGFKVDQEALEEMLGEEIDINLNQLFAGQGNLFSGIGSGSGAVPVREVYWDDIFDFERVSVAGSELFLPLNEQWVKENGEEAESRMLIFTANPAVSYDSSAYRLVLKFDSLANLPLPDSLGRLGDIWLPEQAVWDNGYLIIPLDPTGLERFSLNAEQLDSLAERYPLIVRANPNHILLTFHENWERIRLEPALSIPDYGTWLSNVQSDVSSGISDTTSLIEDGLTEFAISMVLDSMTPGGSSFGNFDLGDDFPVIPVSLGMLAEIEQDTYNPTTISRYDRQPSIGLAIQKEGGANTVLVARQVRAELEKLSGESIGGFSQIGFNTIFDQAEEIERALADLARALIGGAILAIAVLILFLKNWRTTMFIGISIPAAIITTFTLLYFTDITINLMTLGGLALAAGMLVDNAIVVSENIYRHYQMGKKPADASIDGAREVSGAITASTLTTISVFFPVVFLSGLAGQLFWEFALTVACAILASLLVALTVIPLLASRSLRLRREDEPGLHKKTKRLPEYRRMLGLAVKHPWWVLLLAALFIAIGVYGYFTLGSELFPSPDESAFTIDITLPPGSTLNTTDAYISEVESILEKRDEVTSISTSVGSSGFMGMPGGSGIANQGRIRVEIDSSHTREIDQIIEEVREAVSSLPGEADAAFARESLLDAAGLETSLDLVVSGSDLEQVISITEEAAFLLSQHPAFTDVGSSLEESRPEVHITLDHGKALQKGVTLVQVATAVRQALEGIPVSRIETDIGILNIVLGYQRSDINTISDLGKIGFYSPGGEFLHLEDVAELSESFGPQSIPRENQQVVGQIQIQFSGIDLGSATSEAFAITDEIALPAGFEIRAAGSSDIMGDVLSELQLVLIVAALLVYLVMAAQFESLLHPFIIICSLPLAYTGAVLGLIITGNSVSIPAMIGVVVLSGILVNDGIIMVDFINQQRRIHGLPLKEAIIEGASARLRPILMTTATTVLGLVPLALGFGEGSQLQAPMAITIIGGQITGTILLLLAIPSIYKVLTKDVPLPTGTESEVSFAAVGRREKRNFNQPLYKLVLRVIVILILVAVLIYLITSGGEDFLTVIR